MKVEKFTIDLKLDEVELKGSAQIINGRSIIVKMTAPYNGLIRREHVCPDDTFFYNSDRMKGMASHCLWSLYEELKYISDNYFTYNNILKEWVVYKTQIDQMADDAKASISRNMSKEDKKSIQYHIDSLEEDALRYFTSLEDRYEMIPYDLDVVERSLNILAPCQ